MIKEMQTAKSSKRFIFFLVLFIGAFPVKSKGQSVWTFEEACKQTLENHPGLRQYRYMTEEKRMEALSARSLYLPQTAILANYIFLSDDLHLDLTPVRDAITPLYQALGAYGSFSGVPNPDPATQQQIPVLPPELSTLAMRQKMQEGLKKVEAAEWDRIIQKKEFGSIKASVSWPLYAGGRIRAANRIAGLKVEDAEWEERAKAGEAICELTERYYGLVLANQTLRVRQVVLEGMQKHLHDATRMHEEGMMAYVEVLQAKVFEAQAKRELSNAVRMQETARAALMNTLGNPAATIETVSGLFYIDSIHPLEYYLHEALANNPSLQRISLKKQQSAAGTRAERGQFLPTVALQGSHDIANKDLSEFAPAWMAGVGLKWTLFDGLGRMHNLKAAKLREKQVEQFQQKAGDDIATLIQKLYTEVAAYRDQAKQIDIEVEFATELLRMREEAFKQEMAPGKEIADARMLLAKAKTGRLQAMYNYVVSLSRLLQAAGIPEQILLYTTSPAAVHAIFD
jgi:outer membrane protein TolC